MAILATGDHNPSPLTHAPLLSIPKDDEILVFLVDCSGVMDFLHLPQHGTYHPIESCIANIPIQCINKHFHHDAIQPSLLLQSMPYHLHPTLPPNTMQQQDVPWQLLLPSPPNAVIDWPLTLPLPTMLPFSSLPQQSSHNYHPKGNNQLSTLFSPYWWLVAIKRDLLQWQTELGKLLAWSLLLSLPQDTCPPPTSPIPVPMTNSTPLDLASTVESFTKTLNTTINSVHHLLQVLSQLTKFLRTIHAHIHALPATKHILNHKRYPQPLPPDVSPVIPTCTPDPCTP